MKFDIKNCALGALIASVAMLVNVTASAYTITVGGTTVPGEGITTSVAGATVIDFNSGSLPSEYSGGAVVLGSSSTNWASPPGDSSYYFTVGPGYGQSSPGILTLGSLNRYFGFYGGSPDTYNSIELWQDDARVAVISGGSLSDVALVAADGNQGTGVYWNIWADNSSEYFNIIKFISTSNAFETDNHAYLSAVPIPASAWLFISGLVGLIGFSAHKRTTS